MVRELGELQWQHKEALSGVMAAMARLSLTRLAHSLTWLTRSLGSLTRLAHGGTLSLRQEAPF